MMKKRMKCKNQEHCLRHLLMLRPDKERRQLMSSLRLEVFISFCILFELYLIISTASEFY